MSNNRFLSILRFMLFYLEVCFFRLLGVRIVWTVHNLIDHERRDPKLLLLFYRCLVPLFNKLIVHSHYAKVKVAETYRLRSLEKIEVIPHGNYIEAYPDDMTKEMARAELGLSTSDKVFLFFGLIRDYKGLPELIEAFKVVDNQATRLMIVGKPQNEEVRRHLQAVACGHRHILSFFEFIPENRVQVFFRAADVVVLPFRDIFTSGSLLLAMSFGKAVVVPQLESIAEICRGHGFETYPPEDPHGLQKALGTVLGKDLDAMGSYNYQQAIKFGWNQISAQTMQVFVKALQS